MGRNLRSLWRHRARVRLQAGGTRGGECESRCGARREPVSRDAVIVSTARTPIGRAYRGAFNSTPAPTLAAHALRAAIERAGVAPAEVEDCLLGCSLPQGSQHTIG